MKIPVYIDVTFELTTLARGNKREVNGYYLRSSVNSSWYERCQTSLTRGTD